MTTAETRRFNPLVLGVSVLSLALLIFFGISFFRAEVVQVRVSPVTHENLISTVSTTGKVLPVLNFQPHAPTPGVIQKLYVQVGQKVKAGDPLLRMTDNDAAARIATQNSFLLGSEAAYADERRGGSDFDRINAAAEIAQDRLQLQQAQAGLDNLRGLFNKGAASAAEVAAAERRLTTAETVLKTAQERTEKRFSPGELRRAAAQLADARAGMASAKVAYANANIVAPISGTVYSLPVNQYDFVTGGEPLLNLADLDRIQVRAYFDEPEIGKLARGEAVKIVWDAKPNQVWHGHIDRAPNAVIGYGTRSVGECVITVDDAHGDLLPDTNVTVTVTTSQRFNVLSVPREALHTEGANNFVYRVVNHHLVRTSVQVGVFNLTREEIISGLSENDIVALGATSNRELTSGLEVTTTE